jgi:hypothetical protein
MVGEEVGDLPDSFPNFHADINADKALRYFHAARLLPSFTGLSLVLSTI